MRTTTKPNLSQLSAGRITQPIFLKSVAIRTILHLVVRRSLQSKRITTYMEVMSVRVSICDLA
jgi:hypothetical protein